MKKKIERKNEMHGLGEEQVQEEPMSIQIREHNTIKTDVALTQFREPAKRIWNLSFELVIFELDKDQVGKPPNPITQRSLQAIFVDIQYLESVKVEEIIAEWTRKPILVKIQNLKALSIPDS